MEALLQAAQTLKGISKRSRPADADRQPKPAKRQRLQRRDATLRYRAPLVCAEEEPEQDESSRSPSQHEICSANETMRISSDDEEAVIQPRRRRGRCARRRQRNHRSPKDQPTATRPEEDSSRSRTPPNRLHRPNKHTRPNWHEQISRNTKRQAKGTERRVVQSWRYNKESYVATSNSDDTETSKYREDSQDRYSDEYKATTDYESEYDIPYKRGKGAREVKESYWDKHPKWESKNMWKPKNQRTVDKKVEQEAQMHTNKPKPGTNVTHDEIQEDSDDWNAQRPNEGSSADYYPPKAPAFQGKSPPPPPVPKTGNCPHEVRAKPPPPPPPFCQCVSILTGQRSAADLPPCRKTIIPTKPKAETVRQVTSQAPPKATSNPQRATHITSEPPTHPKATNPVFRKPRADKAWLQTGRHPLKPIYLRYPKEDDDSPPRRKGKGKGRTGKGKRSERPPDTTPERTRSQWQHDANQDQEKRPRQHQSRQRPQRRIIDGNHVTGNATLHERFDLFPSRPTST